ncbi:hypothetical protein ACFJGX_01660 [Hydrogenophaga sp. UC242_50]|uniref:hypothetical protein n=1 Tax=Hydrogenophaga sp. UC242_50 TaxID=3350169 RepID=UPI0036D401CF
MEPFKNLIGPATVVNAGHHLRRAWPTFDRKRFEAQAATGLEQLEFKARAMQLADALEATLPDDFNAACELLEASLAPPWPWTPRANRSSSARRATSTASAAGPCGRSANSWRAGAWPTKRRPGAAWPACTRSRSALPPSSPSGR